MSTHPHVDTGPLLRVDHLSVRYGGEGRDILGADDVSLTIAPGEVLGLAGESGSGKSTVANAIMRLLRPPAQITGGTVTFRDQDVLALRGEELRRFRWSEIAMVFQSAMNSLNPVMTVGDQIVDVYTATGAPHATAPSSCSSSWASRPTGWIPTRTSSRAGCASAS
jgi:peptide/nickel transport system ATP-binding protein